MKKLSILLTVLLTIVLFSTVASARRTINVPSTKYPTIQSAIDAASTGSLILVADGTYNEKIDFLGKDIELKSLNGSATTIIDGSGLGPNYSMVRFKNGEGPDSIIDGFTISNGMAVDYGGGINCDNYSSPTIKNCIITGNQAVSAYAGGGIGCRNSSPTITDCEIINNGAPAFGAGIYCSNSSPIITGCTINNNIASGSGISATGVHCENFTVLTISNSDISNNTGSGILIYTDSSATIDNCTINGNTSTSGAMGIYVYTSSDVTVTNSTLNGNDRGVHCSGANTFTIDNCTANNSSTYAGIRVLNAIASISNCTTDGNGGGGINVGGTGSFNISDCIVTNNTSTTGGGIFAMSSIYVSPVTITNCLISGNTATSSYGGGIYTTSNVNSPLTITNCTITGNSTASYGGGIYGYSASGTSIVNIINSTVSDNSADQNAGGAYLGSGINATVINSIFWGDTAASISNEIVLGYNTIIDVTYSDIDGGYTGTGNINADPLFVGGGDYHLSVVTSPCVDAGTSSGAPTHDIDGDLRDANPDIGSDEFVTQ